MRDRYLRLEVSYKDTIFGVIREWTYLEEEKGIVNLMLEGMRRELNKECPDGYTIVYMDTGLREEYNGI